MSFFGSRPPTDAALKYARGVSPRPPGGNTRLTLLEWATLAHVTTLMLALTWGFGGGAEWMRIYFAWFGALGALLTVRAALDQERWHDGRLRALHWLWPLLAFNLLVLAGTLNPSLKELNFDGEILLAYTGAKSGWPSSARPHLAWPALLLFDVLFLACFNVALIVRQRRALRGLLLLLVTNALILSVFGTVQKLSHADGIYFGSVKTRQSYFFASFIYHNHWGAFVLLALAACLGLTWHYARRVEARNFFHSPAFGGLIAVFFLAATIPLSGSRSCTLALLPLFGGALVHWTIRTIRQRRRARESALPPLLGAAAALVLAACGVWFVARDTIVLRANLTRSQVGAMIDQGSIGSRMKLYGDTWRMAKDKIWFGWGMESYPHVFARLYNSQISRQDKLPVFYRDAHSDWLQGFAEHGLVGTTLLALLAIVPLLSLRRRHLGSPLPLFLLAGCALLLLYAWIEFPFGNIAVILTWWLCFFCAVQYALLLESDARPADTASPEDPSAVSNPVRLP